uniref:Uncharacterized protein n=1 Tax=Bicosoecida sp. CB-2014 TaxID=1486930 RepID=A0A7S1G3Z4_9STRA|mmetsp:Transcript_14777/g.51475  ORF Transcript_14777/g.51475 Transcript_14777/m.51475 type:complete len:1047 (+) Transcript_14777:103-3243(+)
MWRVGGKRVFVPLAAALVALALALSVHVGEGAVPAPAAQATPPPLVHTDAEPEPEGAAAAAERDDSDAQVERRRDRGAGAFTTSGAAPPFEGAAAGGSGDAPKAAAGGDAALESAAPAGGESGDGADAKDTVAPTQDTLHIGGGLLEHSTSESHGDTATTASTPDASAERRLATLSPSSWYSGSVGYQSNDVHYLYYVGPWNFPMTVELTPSSSADDPDLYVCCTNCPSEAASTAGAGSSDSVTLTAGSNGCGTLNIGFVKVRVYGYNNRNSGYSVRIFNFRSSAFYSHDNTASVGSYWHSALSHQQYRNHMFWNNAGSTDWPVRIRIIPTTSDVDLRVTCDPAVGEASSSAGGTAVDTVILQRSQYGCSSFSSTESLVVIRAYGWADSNFGGYTLSIDKGFCDPGYYTNGATCLACGANQYYCPGGSGAAYYTVSAGYYTIGGGTTTRTGQTACPQGYYCPGSSNGGYQVACPVNTYGGSTGLSSSSCSGTCSSGYLCPLATITPAACPYGDWCRSGVNQGDCYVPATCNSASYTSTTVRVLTGIATTALSSEHTALGVAQVSITQPSSGSPWTSQLVMPSQSSTTEQLAIVIPPLTSSLANVLDTQQSSVAHMRQLVQKGAALIVFADNSNYALDALNELFSWSLVPRGSVSGSLTATARSDLQATVGFASLSTGSTLPLASGQYVRGVASDSLPVRASRVYGVGSSSDLEGGSEWVWVAPVGCGTVTYIGRVYDGSSTSSEWRNIHHLALKQARAQQWCSTEGDVYVVRDDTFAPAWRAHLGAGARNVAADLIQYGYTVKEVPSPWSGVLNDAAAVPAAQVILVPSLPLATSLTAALSQDFVDDMISRVYAGSTMIVLGTETDADDVLLRSIVNLRVATAADPLPRPTQAPKSVFYTVDTGYEHAVSTLGGLDATHAATLATGTCARRLYSSDEDARAVGAEPPTWALSGEAGCGGYAFFAMDWEPEGVTKRGDWWSLLKIAIEEGYARGAAASSCTPPDPICSLDTTSPNGEWVLFDDASDPGAMSPLADYVQLACRMPSSC